MRHSCPSGVVMLSPKPRTRTVASGGVRVRRAEIEAPDHGIFALGEHLRLGQRRAGAVRLEHAGEADALGVIAPMAERRADRTA